MTLMMSVSGVRGIIGETMTPVLAAELGLTFGTLVVEDQRQRRILAIADAIKVEKLLDPGPESGRQLGRRLPDTERRPQGIFDLASLVAHRHNILQTELN